MNVAYVFESCDFAFIIPSFSSNGFVLGSEDESKLNGIKTIALACVVLARQRRLQKSIGGWGVRLCLSFGLALRLGPGELVLPLGPSWGR